MIVSKFAKNSDISVRLGALYDHLERAANPNGYPKINVLHIKWQPGTDGTRIIGGPFMTEWLRKTSMAVQLLGLEDRDVIDLKYGWHRHEKTAKEVVNRERAARLTNLLNRFDAVQIQQRAEDTFEIRPG